MFPLEPLRTHMSSNSNELKTALYSHYPFSFQFAVPLGKSIRFDSVYDAAIMKFQVKCLFFAKLTFTSAFILSKCSLFSKELMTNIIICMKISNLGRTIGIRTVSLLVS